MLTLQKKDDEQAKKLECLYSKGKAKACMNMLISLPSKNDKHYKYALNWAAKKGHLDLVNALLDLKDVSLNVAGNYYFILSTAINYGHLNIVERLCELEQVKDYLNGDDGKHILDLATMAGQLPIVSRLLEYPNIRSNIEHYLFEGAIAHGHLDIAARLLDIRQMQIALKLAFSAYELGLSLSKDNPSEIAKAFSDWRQSPQHKKIDYFNLFLLTKSSTVFDEIRKKYAQNLEHELYGLLALAKIKWSESGQQKQFTKDVIFLIAQYLPSLKKRDLTMLKEQDMNQTVRSVNRETIWFYNRRTIERLTDIARAPKEKSDSTHVREMKRLRVTN